MAKGDKHFIHKLIFETQVSTIEEYRTTSERISNLVRFSLSDMLSRLFDTIAFESDDLIIIDRIEINLGLISRDKLEEQIYQSVYSKISQYISKLNNDIPSLAKMANFYQWRSGAIEYKTSNYKIIRQRKEQLFQLEDKITLPSLQEIDLVNWQIKYAEVLKFYLRAGYLPSNVYLGDLEIKDIINRFAIQAFPKLMGREGRRKFPEEPISLLPSTPVNQKEVSDTLELILKDPIARERFIQHSVQSLLTSMQDQKLITREEVEKLIKPIAFQWIDILYARFLGLETLDWMEEHKEESIDKILFQLYNHKPSAIQNLMYKLKSDLKKDTVAINERIRQIFKQMSKGSIQKLISALYSKGSYIHKYLNELSRQLAIAVKNIDVEPNKIAHSELIAYFFESEKTPFDSNDFLDFLQSKFSFDNKIKNQLKKITPDIKQSAESLTFKERKYVKADWINQKERTLELAELFTHIIKYGSIPLYNPLGIASLADFENAVENQSDTVYSSFLQSFGRISDKEIARNPLLSKLSMRFYLKFAIQAGFEKNIHDLFLYHTSDIWFKSFIRLIRSEPKIAKPQKKEQEQWKQKQIKKFTRLLISDIGISSRIIKQNDKANFMLFVIKKKLEQGSSFNLVETLLAFINTSTGVSAKEIIKQFSKALDRLLPEIEQLKSKLSDEADHILKASETSELKEDELPRQRTDSPQKPDTSDSDKKEIREAINEELLDKLIPRDEKLFITPAKSDIEKDKLKIPYQSETFESDIAVRNAGLVLCWPFLGYYFGALGLLNDKKDFMDLEARERAVFLLQYLAVKQSTAEEHYLTLNKIMVGYPLDEPISTGIVMTKKEKDISEALLINVIKQWSALKSMKPDGLRGSFIIRDGVLRQMHNGWRLIVDKKGFDLLLNKIPWSLGMIRFSWVSYILNVEWN